MLFRYATQKNIFVIGNIIQIGNIDGIGGHNHSQHTADTLASVNSRINELEAQIQSLTKTIEAQQENIKLLYDLLSFVILRSNTLSSK